MNKEEIPTLPKIETVLDFCNLWRIASCSIDNSILGMVRKGFIRNVLPSFSSTNCYGNYSIQKLQEKGIFSISFVDIQSGTILLCNYSRDARNADKIRMKTKENCFILNFNTFAQLHNAYVV